MDIAERQRLFKRLKNFEKKGDLLGQATVLNQALANQGILAEHQVLETLKSLQELSHRREQRQPSEMFSLDQQNVSLNIKNSHNEEIKKNVPLNKEPRFQPKDHLNWTSTGHSDLLVLNVEGGELETYYEYTVLTSSQKSLVINHQSQFLNIKAHRNDFLNIQIPMLVHGAIPIDPVTMLPLDIAVSPFHQVLAICDRGAGKVHLFSRENYRIVKSWSVNAKPSKKCMSLAFHPDGKRIFTTANQPQNLGLIDRNIVMKKINVNDQGILGTLACSPRGDLLYVLCIQRDTRRPDILILDTEKFQLQGRIALEGEAFSTSADPQDLFIVDPSGRWAVVMVSKNQPNLFTPTLLLINLKTQEVVDQKILTSQTKPIHIGFPVKEYFSPEIKLIPTLIQSELISKEQIRHIFGRDQN